MRCSSSDVNFWIMDSNKYGWISGFIHIYNGGRDNNDILLFKRCYISRFSGKFKLKIIASFTMAYSNSWLCVVASYIVAC
jgi:hypothetical protein